MILRSGLGLIAALLLGACAAGGAPSVQSASPAATPSVQPSETPTQAATVTLPPAEGGETVTGTLGYDGIEGGCPYVEADDGTRYEVQYPDGYAIDRSNGDLIGPGGEVVVPLGGELELRGAVQTDLGSICQLGPIFRAVEVTAGR
jgi:hypothetical protein